MKTALITGITGQDGAYLADFLLEKCYCVWGLKRRTSLFNTNRIDHLIKDTHENNTNFNFVYGDMTDSTNLIRIIQDIQPDEIYNLAAQSHVKVSFDTPEYTANTDGLGTLRILEAVRLLKMVEKTRIYQASTSELFGKVQEVPQTEKTPFYPRSPYAVAKLYAYWITINYREAYGMYACNGILHNHESALRGETFVTRKITRGLAHIAFGLQQKLYLGNLDAKRDWGHAKDYIRAMYLILQQEQPDDYLTATGITTEIREFVKKSFIKIGINISFTGKGIEEKGIIDAIDSNKFEQIVGIAPQHLVIGQTLIEVDPSYFRPTEVDLLIGDARKIREKLGWSPEYSLDDLIQEMVIHDIEQTSQKKLLQESGFIVRQSIEEKIFG
ncbi:GDP-mannose 4,6-dehydratase [Lutibacter sp.]